MTYKDADGWNTEEASLSKLRDGAVCVVGRKGGAREKGERETNRCTITITLFATGTGWVRFGVVHIR